jgi:hypothetical protein
MEMLAMTRREPEVTELLRFSSAKGNLVLQKHLPAAKIDRIRAKKEISVEKQIGKR